MESRNRIWEPYLAVLQRDEDMTNLHYEVKNSRVSPYLELQADSLYENEFYRESLVHLSVNPYIRFFAVFDSLLTPDDLGYEEFNQALSDIFLHYLADLDLKLGMCKRDFYIKFFVREMEQGAYGGVNDLEAFTGMERQVIAEWLLHFYRTGDYQECLSGAVRALMPTCEVLVREGEEFVLHMREPWSEPMEQKLKFLLRLFLPLSSDYIIHWIQTYGVTGYEETMQLESFVLA